MRVIAGKARRLPLKAVPGLETRPTTDRIKETLFNILQNEIPGSRFLDLFSGSGGIGIEALSRGAREAVFVEQGRAATDCIRANLAFTKLEKNAVVLQCDVLLALARMEGQAPFELIFMDPPYRQGLERMVLEYLAAHTPSYLTEDTLIIVEAALGTDLSCAGELGFSVLRVKEYKTNMHFFLKYKGRRAQDEE